jgi:hypothetical protein
MVPVITRSGGYMNLFIGWSGASTDKPLRQRYSEKELLGRVRVTKFTRKEQVETFSNAPWWEFGSGILHHVVEEVKYEDWFKKLPDYKVLPLLVLQGGIGQAKVGGIIFDQCTYDLVKATKMYTKAKPYLEGAWGACLKGLRTAEEPFADLVNGNSK